MTYFHADTETDFSDGEKIYSDSDISSDESMHTSDEDFIDDETHSSTEDETESSTEDETESSTEDETEDEYIPQYKKRKLDGVFNIINVSITSSEWWLCSF